MVVIEVINGDIDKRVMNNTWKDIISIYPPWFEYLGWGFECGPGWHDIIKELVQNIFNYLSEKNDSSLENFRITQIKEKYGSLRFYFDWGDDYIFDVVSQAELKTETICEICGNEGMIRNVGSKGWPWLSCLCDFHYECTMREKEPKNG